MNRTKVKSNHVESGSDESNNSSHKNQLDLSLLRKPIRTSVEGFEEVFRAFRDGTDELRKLLSKECDLIYECKVCRNIFRSLTNFISHKRVYCRNSFNSTNHFHFNSNGFTVQDMSTIIQTEQKSNSGPKSTNAGTVAAGNEDKAKDISGIVEQILWKQHQSRNSNVNDFYDQIQNRDESTAKKKKRKKQTLMLNRVNDSDVAVFQSILTDNDNSNMKDEINEVHKMLSKNTILGPDGKIINLFNSQSRTDSPALSTEGSDITSHTCQVCNLQFETQKMLKVHLELKHLPSSYVYQCPSCIQKFSTSAAVIRHLSNDHKKSNRRIRLMRDSIINKRMRADEIVKKNLPSASREVQKLQQQLNGNDSCSKDDMPEWNEIDLKGGGSLDDLNTCPYCLKKFERKAVYTSHVQMCSDIKDREIEKLKKRKAKDDTKVKGVSMELEDSNISEAQPTDANNVNKRKRKRTSKIKSEEIDQKADAQEDSCDIVDWNLDDEEEKRKIENIKKEIIADEYKKMEIKIEHFDEEEKPQQLLPEQLPIDDDDEDSGLIIDEKADIKEEPSSGTFKCPQCDKFFETNEKLKTHLTCYHSRQKRFRCKICDYQGYRKKDTLNHLNFVHNVGATLDQLFQYVETVNKAVCEADILKQKEIKRGQTKLKRQLARQMQRKKAKDENETSINESESDPKVEFKSPEAPSIDSSPATLPQTPVLVSPPMQVSPSKSDFFKSASSDEEDTFDQQRRKSSSRACKNASNASNNDISPESNQRPIRTRVKPVNKDFLYDLSDLLKKEQEAHRESVFQSSNLPGKRELRKRAMSTSVRDSLESPSKLIMDVEAPPQFLLPTKSSNDLASPSKNRRMSVFVHSSRPMFNPPSVPVAKPAHKNAGMALKMATKAFDGNKASLYERKFMEIPSYRPKQMSKFISMLSESASTSSSNSAASSILQKLTGAFKPMPTKIESQLSKVTPEQLCKKFEHFNVTNELDIPRANAINLSTPGGENNLMTLALGDAKNDDVCVLQECSADSTDSDDSDSDSEPRLEIHSEGEKQVKKGRGRPRKNTGKLTKSQQRLTVMQRLQENKIKKSREQIFKRLMKGQTDDDDDDDDNDEGGEEEEINDTDSSPDYLSGEN